MPCYSRIQTELLELPAIKEAADKLRFTVITHDKNTITVKSDLAEIRLQRRDEKSKYVALAGYGEGDYTANILEPLTMGYGKVLLKKWAVKNGYTMSAGQEQFEYVLTQY